MNPGEVSLPSLHHWVVSALLAICSSISSHPESANPLSRSSSAESRDPVHEELALEIISCLQWRGHTRCTLTRVSLIGIFMLEARVGI